MTSMILQIKRAKSNKIQLNAKIFAFAEQSPYPPQEHFDPIYAGSQ